jgi:branched-chain amino acid transport system ATP-binding protein
MLEIRNLSTYYGRIQALRGVSLDVREGEIVTLIGANGAGKTTLLNSISGMAPAQSGSILFDGKDIVRWSSDRVVKVGISQVPERRQMFAPLSVVDNLRLGAYLRHRGGNRADIEADMERVFELFPVLAERRRQAAGTLSGGEQQMVAIGRGVMARPRLMLLDEPSLGLAPLLVQEIFRAMLELREMGTTILVVEQNAAAALRVADRGYCLETGTAVISGTADELLVNEEVQNAYLGGRTAS